MEIYNHGQYIPIVKFLIFILLSLVVHLSRVLCDQKDVSSIYNELILYFSLTLKDGMIKATVKSNNFLKNENQTMNSINAQKYKGA